MPSSIRSIDSRLFGGIAARMINYKSVKKMLAECFFDLTHHTDDLIEDYYKPIASPETKRVIRACVANYDDEDVNCCCSIVSKINPIKEIQSIQIFKNNQNLDLMINFNGVYNRINDEFKISLNRVMVSIHPIAYV